MSNFYTNVICVGNNILYRGVENGRRVKLRVGYTPTMFLPSNKVTKWKTLHEESLEEIKLGSMSAAPNKDKKIFVDVRMSVYELKKIIQYFFQYDVKFDLVYPAFHLAGKKTLDDDRALSDYGLRNGSRLIISLRIQSGYRGGTRRSKRKGRKTRRN